MNDNEKIPRPLRVLVKKLGKRMHHEPETREEFLELLRRSGEIIGQEAADTIERVLQVSELRVRDVMIPRKNMVTVGKDWPPEKMLEVLVQSAHSRFPVVDGEPGKVAGIFLAKDLLRHFHDSAGRRFKLRDWLRPPVFIPESKRLNVLLGEFRAGRSHMAIVVDEYGEVSGLVTIEDVLEQIVGDIEDEHDFDEEGMILPRGRDEFTVKAHIPIADFNEHFAAEFSDQELDTIGGLVTRAFGHVPKRGETVGMEGFVFEVLNADSRRVYLLRVRRTQAAGGAA